MRKETIGNATLYEGDCLEVLQELRPKASCVFADPPYLMGSASSRAPAGRFRSRVPDWQNASMFYSAWMALCWSALADDGALWICGNWRSMPTLMIAADAIGAQVASTVIWDKYWIGVGPLNGLRQRYELVLHLAKDNHAIGDRSEPDIWRIQWSSQRPSGHESEKPVGLPRKAIDFCPNGLVLDPFMGSGTTGVAALAAGRPFIGIEMGAHWFDVACERITNATRQEQLFAAPTGMCRPECGG